MVLSYLGEGRWRSSSARNGEYLEAFRDMRYSVLWNLATKRYLGLPLQGAAPQPSGTALREPGSSAAGRRFSSGI